MQISPWGGHIIISTPTPILKIPETQHISFVSEADIKKIFRKNGITLIKKYGLVLFPPLIAKFILTLKDIDLRNKLYYAYVKLPLNYPIFASQAVYVGYKSTAPL